MAAQGQKGDILGSWDLVQQASFGALLQEEEHKEEGKTSACETNSSDMQLGGDLSKMAMFKTVAQGKTILHAQKGFDLQ